MSTVRKIAADAGVSVGTVSRVLNNHRNVSGDARRRVLASLAETGYTSPVLARRSVRAIGLLSTGGPIAVGGRYDLALLRGIYDGLASHDYNLMLLDAQRNRQAGEPLGQTLARLGVCGLLVRTTSASAGIVSELAAGPLPAVLVADPGPPGVHLPAVVADSTTAVRRAIHHLAGLGHRRIAITLNIVVDYDHLCRYEQWAASMRDEGLEPSADLVMRVPADRGAGAVALRQLMAMNDRPTAVFTTDPPAAAGLLREAIRLGIDIPGQLSLVGFDDEDLRHDMHPPLNAVCQDAAALGRLAFERLERLIRDDAAKAKGRRKRRAAPAGAEPRAPEAAPAEPVADLESIECWYEPHATVGPPPQPRNDFGNVPPTQTENLPEK